MWGPWCGIVRLPSAEMRARSGGCGPKLVGARWGGGRSIILSFIVVVDALEIMEPDGNPMLFWSPSYLSPILVSGLITLPGALHGGEGVDGVLAVAGGFRSRNSRRRVW